MNHGSPGQSEGQARPGQGQGLATSRSSTGTRSSTVSTRPRKTVDEKTKGKYSDKIQTGTGKAKGAMDRLAHKDDGAERRRGATHAAPGRPPPPELSTHIGGRPRSARAPGRPPRVARAVRAAASAGPAGAAYDQAATR